ncbi:transmembrane channel-like protein 3 [Gigantopelta aegis]|uniref:transmembrane channel-like protein 3 n=1 Tax=Gigantopelta aegis TaxID=1735272 RepID=UPI001B8879A2|nr:transmembrane channel-like protein 3 [Gigantopelta aegis]
MKPSVSRAPPITQETRDHMINVSQQINRAPRDQSSDSNHETKSNVQRHPNFLGNVYLQQRICFKYRPSFFGKYVEYEFEPYCYTLQQTLPEVVEEVPLRHQPEDGKTSHVITNNDKDKVNKTQTSMLQNRNRRLHNDEIEKDTCRMDVTSMLQNRNRRLNNDEIEKGACRMDETSMLQNRNRRLHNDEIEKDTCRMDVTSMLQNRNRRLNNDEIEKGTCRMDETSMLQNRSRRLNNDETEKGACRMDETSMLQNRNRPLHNDETEKGACRMDETSMLQNRNRPFHNDEIEKGTCRMDETSMLQNRNRRLHNDEIEKGTCKMDETSMLQNRNHRLHNDEIEKGTWRAGEPFKADTKRTVSAGSRSNRRMNRRKSNSYQRKQQRRQSFTLENDDDELMQVYDREEASDQTEEDILENIQEQKELIDSVKFQPWRMSKKLKILRLARAYVENHEVRLSRGKGYQQRGMQAFRQLKRSMDNFISMLVPWEMTIKRIESHFGSVVASYFVFLRWLIWINIWLTLIPVCFVIIPELIVGQPYGSTDRKKVPDDEAETSADLKTLWNAEGILKYSVVFYGYYGNEHIIGTGYRQPLAYLLSSLAAFAFSFIVVLKTMAGNSRQSRMSTKDENFTFSWKLFTDWDYMIGNKETATTKHASLVTTFREAILEEQEKKKEENRKLLIFLRVLANVLVLILLALSTYIIQVFVGRSRKMEEQKLRDPNYDAGFWAENELTIIMTLISTLFPNISDLISLMEKYHPRTNLRLQLASFSAESGAWDKRARKDLDREGEKTLKGGTGPYLEIIQGGGEGEWGPERPRKVEIARQMNATMNVTCSASISLSTVSPASLAITTVAPAAYTAVDPSVTPENVTQNCTTYPTELCWETMIGQEVWKLTIMDTIFVVGQIIIIDLIRSVFIRYCNNLCCWDMEKKFPEYPDFKTAENLLHLINNQGVIWLGTFFAPGLPLLNFVKLLALVYIRCWSVMACNVPQERIFRASRSNNFYFTLLLVMLFLCMLPPLFAIVAVDPSPNCGPFSMFGRSKIFYVITDTMDKELPSWVNSALEYAASPGVIIPVFLLLAMTIYYLVSVGRSLRDANTELRMQLEYERTEGRRKVYAMADAKREMEASKNKVLPDVPPKPKRNMSQAASSMMAVARMAKMLSGDMQPTKISNKAKIPVAVVAGKRTLKGSNPRHNDQEHSQEVKLNMYNAASKFAKRIQNKGKSNGLLSSASADAVTHMRRSGANAKVVEDQPTGNRRLTPSRYTEASENSEHVSAHAHNQQGQGREQDQGRDQGQGREYDHGREHDQGRDQGQGRDQDQGQDRDQDQGREQGHGQTQDTVRHVERPANKRAAANATIITTRPVIECEDVEVIPPSSKMIESFDKSRKRSTTAKPANHSEDVKEVVAPSQPLGSPVRPEEGPARNTLVDLLDDAEPSPAAPKQNRPRVPPKTFPKKIHLKKNSLVKPKQVEIPPTSVEIVNEVLNSVMSPSREVDDDDESAVSSTVGADEVAQAARSAIPKIRVVDYSDDNHSVSSDKEVELHNYNDKGYESPVDDSLLQAPRSEPEQEEYDEEEEVKEDVEEDEKEDDTRERIRGTPNTTTNKMDRSYSGEADVESMTSEELGEMCSPRLRKANYFTAARAVFEKQLK